MRLLAISKDNASAINQAETKIKQTLQCTQQCLLNTIFLPVVEVIIRKRVEVVFNHVIVSHGLVDERLVRTHRLWDGLDVFSLLSEVLDGVGPLSQLVGNLLEVITDLYVYYIESVLRRVFKNIQQYGYVLDITEL